MRIEEHGLGSEEPGAADTPLDPKPSILSPAFLQRLRWRCRRGLLELDIVLGRFIDQQYAGLDAAQREAFNAVLDLPDTVLWDMVAGRQDAVGVDQQAVLEKIRTV